jgi:hypothetical protein
MEEQLKEIFDGLDISYTKLDLAEAEAVITYNKANYASSYDTAVRVVNGIVSEPSMPFKAVLYTRLKDALIAHGIFKN